MYQALYRKYRPRSFDDVCGQEHITSVLKTQLQKGRVSHAYIFCGSRGTGKTTCAKILAKAVNCENPIDGEPCNQCSSCKAINEERVMDVVEMDAASNNGVDHIRRLCDEVQFLPSEAKKRVYIVDEVHMLSTSAFNALLKTIEEPPEHVLFILATTEVNDIPATIMSRCQRFDFKRITPQIVADRLMYVAKQENIPLHADAATVIARLSDGAMRDALSLLEACQGYQGEITVDQLHSILGLSSRQLILSLASAVLQQNTAQCLRYVSEIYEKSGDFKEVIGELIAVYRDLLVIQSVEKYQDYVDCYENELSVLEELSKLAATDTILHQIKILEDFYASFDRIASGKKASSEILMIRLCRDEISSNLSSLLSRVAKIERAIETGVATPVASKIQEVVSSPAQAPQNAPEMKEKAKPAPPAPQNENASFAGSGRLKSSLQNVAFLKPWMEHVTFDKKGNQLVILCADFTKGILSQASTLKLIEEKAREIDPDIQGIVFESLTENKSNRSNEFDGL